MKRSGFLCLSSITLASLLFALSCASQPKAASGTATVAAQAQASPAVPEKQRKERIVVVKVPVLVKEVSLYADGLVDEYFVYKYADGLRALSSKETFDTSRMEAIERLVTEVVGGRLTAETVLDADTRVRSRHEYGYDADGRVNVERVLDTKGALQSSSTYAYDAAGNRIEWKALDGKGVLKALARYSFSSGRLVLIEMSDGSGKKTGSISIEYDAAGLVTKRSYKAADGSLQKYETYTYADGKATTEETHRADGSLMTKTTNTYGSLGELLSTTTTDAAGSAKDRRTFEYSIREDRKTEVYYE